MRDGFFVSLWQNVFSPKYPLMRVDDFKAMGNGRVCFEHAFFDAAGGEKDPHALTPPPPSSPRAKQSVF